MIEYEVAASRTRISCAAMMAAKFPTYPIVLLDLGPIGTSNTRTDWLRFQAIRPRPNLLCLKLIEPVLGFRACRFIGRDFSFDCFI